MRTVRVATVGLVCTVLLVLTGCIKVDLDLQVHSDNTISGTMILGVDKNLPNARETIEQMNSELPPGATSEPWSDDTYTGVQVTYDKVPIDEFTTPSATGGDAGLDLRREGAFFILGSPPDGSPPDTPDLTGLQVVYRVRMTFPGPVVEGNGTIDGKSIEWTDTAESPYVKARATGSVLVPVLIATGVVLVLAAAVLLVVLMVRRQRADHPATLTAGGLAGTDGTDPTQFTGVQTDQTWHAATGQGGGATGATAHVGSAWDQPSDPGDGSAGAAGVPDGSGTNPWQRPDTGSPDGTDARPWDESGSIPWGESDAGCRGQGADGRESPWQRPG